MQVKPNGNPNCLKCRGLGVVTQISYPGKSVYTECECVKTVPKGPRPKPPGGSRPN